MQYVNVTNLILNANLERQRSKHQWVGTAHALIALVLSGVEVFASGKKITPELVREHLQSLGIPKIPEGAPDIAIDSDAAWRVSPRFYEMLANADTCARAHGHRGIDGEDLLYGLLVPGSEGASEAQLLLQKLGVDSAALLSKLCPPSTDDDGSWDGDDIPFFRDDW